MKNKLYIIVTIGIFAIFTQSCMVTEPYYTTVKKLYEVKPGMTLKKVAETLAIQPYDFYYNISNENMVYVFKYKHMYHKMTLVMQKPDVRNEPYLNSGGSEFYKEPGDIYMEFDKSKKLVGYHTTKGRANNVNILKHENTIKAIQQDYTKFNALDDEPKKSKKSNMLKSKKFKFLHKKKK